MIFHHHPQPLMEEKLTRKEWGDAGTCWAWNITMNQPCLQTINRLITEYRNDPNYRVKSITSPIQGYSVEDLKKIRDGIFEKRRATQPLTKQLQQGKQSLESTPPSKSKESPPTSLEKAVMNRRPFFWAFRWRRGLLWTRLGNRRKWLCYCWRID